MTENFHYFMFMEKGMYDQFSGSEFKIFPKRSNRKKDTTRLRSAFSPITLFSAAYHRNKSNIMITAHRGASAYAPENTMAAIELALQSNVHFIEIDVQLSQDGEVILLHDPMLERTTSGLGKVWQYSLKELIKFDAGSWFSTQFNNEYIPTLREVMKVVSGRAKLNIEVKSNSERPHLIDKVLDVVQEMEFENDCIVSSFNRDYLSKVRQRDERISIGLISSVGIPTDMSIEKYHYLICSAPIVDREIILHAHNAGKRIHVWTVNRAHNMRRFIRMGVDGIITDRPDLLYQIVRN